MFYFKLINLIGIVLVGITWTLCPGADIRELCRICTDHQHPAHL